MFLRGHSVQEWTSLNKLSLNLSKTKELVFKRPNLCLEIILRSDDFDVERFQCANCLEFMLTLN